MGRPIVVMGEEIRGKIAFARIAGDGDNVFSLEFRTACQQHGGPQICPGRDAGVHAFTLEQKAGGLFRFFCGNGKHTVDYGGIIHLWYEIRADALNAVRRGLSAGKKRRFCGFNGKGGKGRIVFLQIFCRAAERCPGTYAGGKGRGFKPLFSTRGGNFRSSCFIVDGRPGRIVKLARPEGSRGGAQNFFRLVQRALHPEFCIRQNQFRSHAPQENHSFFAGRCGHGQDQTQIQGRTNKGQTYAEIAAGGFYHGSARSKPTACESVFNIGSGRTILDGAAGIAHFQFDMNLRSAFAG